MVFEGARILVTGGTGSLGQVIVHRLVAGGMGRPEAITVLSRDEAKQQDMRLSYLYGTGATDEVARHNFQQLLRFQIGDMRDYDAVGRAVRGADIIVHAAALKQVPTCEYFPYEAVLTNLHGTQNLLRAVREQAPSVKKVVGISTDKACKPINVMGMTKAIMERMFVEANLDAPGTTFLCARYGNVVASRGSVVPVFLEQVQHGGPVTVTDGTMTRFMLSHDAAADTVFAALQSGGAGQTYVPRARSARMSDLARVLIDGRDIPIVFTGIRPGEKLHEILVSEEECHLTVERNGYYVIRPMLPEIAGHDPITPALSGEYSSEKVLLDEAGLRRALAPYMHGRAAAGAGA